jgi:hypothetical protein
VAGSEIDGQGKGKREKGKGKMRVMSCRLPVCAAVAVGVVLCAGMVGAQTPPLGEVARKEAERRKEATPADKVYTNKDLPASAQDRPPMPSPYADPADPDQADPAPAPRKEDVAPGQPVRDEAWWRARIDAARDGLRENEIAVEALQARINVLSRDFVSRDNPVQRAQIGEERASALEELSRTRAAIERSRQEIAEIEDEARRAGVPPGWLR